MKNTLLILVAMLISTSAFAGSVKCELTSGKKTSSVTQDLEKLTVDPLLADDSTYDLFMAILSTCKEGACSTEVTLMSSKQEDDFSYPTFDFTAGKKEEVVYTETISKQSSPDHRKYVLTCTYLP